VTYHFRINKDAGWYWAEGVELEGCLTQGKTLDELKSNLHEALNLYLDEPANSPVVFPPPDPNIAGDDVLVIPVAAEVSFSMLLRQHRLKRNLTQKQVAEKMGMKNIYSYQRLERRSNPNLKTIGKVKTIFPELPLESVF